MIKPTIHMNGTSAKMLADGYEQAYIAVHAAMKSFEKIEFNARDYYPQEVGAWEQACKEQRNRLLQLKSVEDELLELTLHCRKFIK